MYNPTNIFLFFALAIWHLIGTAHFGHNWVPETDAEVIMDGMMILGLIMLFKKQTS